jgi:hypothetical protein
MNLEQFKSLMNSNETAAAASPLGQQEPVLPLMTGIRSNTNVHGTLQQRQVLLSSRVSQYARLQQRQAVAAAATMALLRREQEQCAANVAAIVAAHSNQQQQYRTDQLRRELLTLYQMDFLRSDSPRTTQSLMAASSALSLAQNPMIGTNMALMLQQQQEPSLQMIMMMMGQQSNMMTSVSSTNLHPSSLRSQQMYPYHAPGGEHGGIFHPLAGGEHGGIFHPLEANPTFGSVNHDDVTHTIPLSQPVCLARSVDKYKLSDHQNFLRQQIEAFQATQDDVMTHTRGRNKPVQLGQVGIRCRHCAHIPVSRRQMGSTYFPSNKFGIYQAAQNMSTAHIQCGLCTEMPVAIKWKFIEIASAKKPKGSHGAGRLYWAHSATQLGLVDTEEGIRFIRDVTP